MTLCGDKVNREFLPYRHSPFMIQTQRPGLYLCFKPLCPFQLRDFPFRVWGGQKDGGLLVSLLLTRKMTYQPSTAPAT